MKKPYNINIILLYCKNLKKDIKISLEYYEMKMLFFDIRHSEDTPSSLITQGHIIDDMPFVDIGAEHG